MIIQKRGKNIKYTHYHNQINQKILIENIVSIIKLIMIILILRSGLNCLLVSYRKFKILTFIKIFS